MAVYITDPDLEKRLKSEREANGSDRLDEVWDGVYFMPRLANNEHQFFVIQLAQVFQSVLGNLDQGMVYPGVNVSNREKGWKKNYRCPDVAVFLPGSKAKNCGTHWHGGPDFAVEIVSPKDRSREKLPFYSSVGVGELLLIDRQPWSLELFRLQGGELVSSGRSTIRQPVLLVSSVLPVKIRLLPSGRIPRSQTLAWERRANGKKHIRPCLEILHHDGVQRRII